MTPDVKLLRADHWAKNPISTTAKTEEVTHPMSRAWMLQINTPVSIPIIISVKSTYFIIKFARFATLLFRSEKR